MLGPEVKWTIAGAVAYVACAHAAMDQRERALKYLNELPAAIEQGASWGINYILMSLFAATTIWQLNSTDHVEVIERNISLSQFAG